MKMESVIIGLVIISVMILATETVPGLHADVLYWLVIAEVVITALFTVEYFFRIWKAEDRRGYILSFMGIVDLIAILPTYLLGQGTQFVRVIRVLKFLKYSRGLQTLGLALMRAKDQFVVFFVATVIVLVLSAFGIYFFENGSQPEEFSSVYHSLWWAVATLTTVGYGDVYPVTVGGKLFASLVVIFGLAIVAGPAGILAASLSEVAKEKS